MQNVKKLIVYDGICLLCNGFVLFIIQRDKKDLFRFATLQSQTKLENVNKGLASVLLIDGNKTYDKSTAAIRILAMLNNWWKPLLLFLIFPKVIRDSLYSLIARNRYKLFGKADSCIIPDDSIKHKFIM